MEQTQLPRHRCSTTESNYVSCGITFCLSIRPEQIQASLQSFAFTSSRISLEFNTDSLLHSCVSAQLRSLHDSVKRHVWEDGGRNNDSAAGLQCTCRLSTNKSALAGKHELTEIAATHRGVLVKKTERLNLNKTRTCPCGQWEVSRNTLPPVSTNTCFLINTTRCLWSQQTPEVEFANSNESFCFGQ